MQKKVTKAVFPVAGLGTRFLPATKASPKEMLPIVDKPLIQYAVEEAIAAGIDTMIFITGRNKNSIQDHFDKAYELENELKNKGNFETLDFIKNLIPPHITCVFIRQSEALGLGHAVLCAKPIVGDDPFAVILADDLVEDGNRGCIKQLVDLFEEEHYSIVAVEDVPHEHTDKYGIVNIEEKTQRIGNMLSIVEKPSPENAPSDLAVIGRYILTARVFEHLSDLGKGAGGEIQLTDGISRLLEHEQVLTYRFEGKRYDCGSKLGYLIANVDHGLLHDELRDDFLAYLKNLVNKS